MIVPKGTPHPLDAQIDQLFRERHELMINGEAGHYDQDECSYVGASPRYTQVLAELKRLTHERISDLQIKEI